MSGVKIKTCYKLVKAISFRGVVPGDNTEKPLNKHLSSIRYNNSIKFMALTETLSIDFDKPCQFFFSIVTRLLSIQGYSPSKSDKF